VIKFGLKKLRFSSYVIEREGTARRMSRRKKLAYRILSVAIAALLAMVGAECLYRANRLLKEKSVNSRSSFELRNNNMPKVRPNLEFGYEYVQSNSPITYFRNDKVWWCPSEDFDLINSVGNPGAESADYDSADVRILIFGDSFTAFSQGGRSYPNILEESLARELGKDVSIVNCARGATGVLQAIDAASHKIPILTPDLVIFAFITGDFDRKRIWVKEGRTEGGEPLLFETTDPKDTTFDPMSHSIWFIDMAEIPQGWCQEQLEDPDPDDPLLRAILDRRDELIAQDVISRVPPNRNLFRLDRSFLLNRLLYGWPYHDRRRRISGFSYSRDAKTLESIRAIDETGIPYYFVHLPYGPEVMAGTCDIRGQNLHLKNSLEKLTGKNLIHLAETSSITLSAAEVARFNLAPYDHHPSSIGLNYYADSLTEVFLPIIRTLKVTDAERGS